MDVVGDKQLQDRVRRKDGSDSIVSKQDNTEDQPQPKRRISYEPIHDETMEGKPDDQKFMEPEPLNSK